MKVAAPIYLRRSRKPRADPQRGLKAERMSIECQEKKALNAKGAKEEDAKGAKNNLLCVLCFLHFAPFAFRVFSRPA